MIILFLVLICRVFCDEQGFHPLHPYLTQATDIQCDSTTDCLAYYGNDWCHQNTVCIKQQCHTIPNYRCKVGEVCLSDEKKCVVRQCSTHGHCDDGIFCNGVERCVNSQCIEDERFACSHGICSERDHSCHTPLLLADELLRIKEEQKHQQQHQQQITVNTITIQDTSNSTTNDTVQDWVWVIVGLSAGFFAIVLVILLVSRASRPSSPVIVFDRQKSYGNGDNYQQTIVY